MPSVISDSGIVASAAGTYGNSQYEVQSNGTVQITKYTGSDTSITLPSSINGKDVTSVSGYAFNGNTTITSISLPGTFTTVPSLAFYGCYALETVTLPDTITEIGSYAFEFCDKLTTVNVRGKLKYIYNGAFYCCYSLSNFKFGNDLISVGYNAFLNTALTSATLPNSLTTIGDRALGFNYKNSTYIKTDGFTIKGAAGSGAETYAEENGFEFIKTEFPLVNNSTVSAETITLGEKVTLAAKAVGGTAPYTYALLYKKASSSTWSKIGEKYGTESTGSFKPGAAVPYDVMINVKDSTGKIVSKSFKITVNTGSTFKNTSTVLSLGLIYGEDLCVIPKAEGGTAPYKMIDYAVKKIT